MTLEKAIEFLGIKNIYNAIFYDMVDTNISTRVQDYLVDYLNTNINMISFNRNNIIIYLDIVL